LSKSSGFVEAADINFTRVWDPERLCAKYRFLNHSDDRVVDSERKLHWEIWRNNISDDHNTSKHDLVSTTVRVFESLLHHMITCNQSEAKENQQVVVYLTALNRDTVRTEQDHSHKLSLFSLESIFEHVDANSIFLTASRYLCEMREISIDVLTNVLKNFSTTVKNMLLVKALDIKNFVSFILLSDTLLDERLTLTS